MNDLWPAVYPKRALHPEFRQAVRVSMANAFRAKMQRKHGEAPTMHGMSGLQLTAVAGFPHPSELTRVISAKPVGTTPLMIGRLKTLAKAVGYTGEMFSEETDTLVAAHQEVTL